jgi:hypothetical protein
MFLFKVEMDETVTIQGQEYIEDVTEEAVASPIQPPETIIEEHIDVSSAAPVEFPDGMLSSLSLYFL